MEPITVATILDLLSRGSATGAAVLIVYALVTERLVPKRRLDDMRAQVTTERDDCRGELKALAMERDRARRERDRLRRELEACRRSHHNHGG